jgi:hypothetical protein
VARNTQRLRVGLVINTTGPERHDVITNGRDLDATPHAERLPSE